MHPRLASLALFLAVFGMLLAPFAATAATIDPRGPFPATPIVQPDEEEDDDDDDDDDGPSRPNRGVDFPVTGSGDSNQGPVTFEGTFSVERFSQRGSRVVASGWLSGDVKDSAGQVLRGVDDRRVNLPVQSFNGGAEYQQFAAQQAVCDILTLNLGPLNLDLLGLVVDLSAIDLVITAERGPGNLLGNLLCAIAGLLDPSLGQGTLGIVVDLLNSILDILSL